MIMETTKHRSECQFDKVNDKIWKPHIESFCHLFQKLHYLYLEILFVGKK